MADFVDRVTTRQLQPIVWQIVDRFRPNRISLFGSYASGTATEDSDVDLLVVTETQESPLHTAARISAAIDHPFPIDIVVYTPREWMASLSRWGKFATEVATFGTILYEA